MLCILIPSPSQAESDNPFNAIKGNPKQSQTDETEAGSVSYGFGFGYSNQQALNSSQQSGVKIGIFNLQLLSRIAKFSQGQNASSLEIVTEAMFARTFGPGWRNIHGAIGAFRFNLRASRVNSIFLEAGVGISSFGLKVPELTGRMQYVLLAGGGFRHHFRNRKKSCYIGYRAIHFSNNGTEQPNQGINLHTIGIGITFHTRR